MLNNKNISVGLEVKLHTIQAIRLIGALLESDFYFYFPESYESILRHLKKHFNIQYGIGLSNVPILSNISIEHSTPLCRIGEIEKPLIFPIELLDHCKSKWKTNRIYNYLFTGLIPRKRMEIIRRWIITHSDQARLRIKFDLALIYLLNKIVVRNNKINSRKYSIFLTHQENLLVVMSIKGRTFPIKAWDEKYYNLMSNTKFVLCPNGDFIWTYRFFEAILCGAIPIIENESNIYEGFHYYKFSDPSKHLIYNIDLVQENFIRANELLTIPKKDLNHEISKLLNC